ncbi:MAG: glutamate--tRNA ligase [Gammaproteobacteria bacterium]|nr:glutamate--tRNA ligase [Gammaproteobacteria bacterium]
MITKSVRTRFAPSPTGFLHIGGVRTALFCWLFAKNQGGQFLLRIEDTDLERSTKESIDAILQGMSWLGLDHDEEIIYQSKRKDLYHQKTNELIQKGHAYRCYCTQEELDQKRAIQLKEGQNPKYDGTCRDLSQDIKREGDYVVRFKSQETENIVITDQLYGSIEVFCEELDDFIIFRSNSMPTYHLAVVVDDHDSAITHVIRGDDHLKNTVKHIQLFKALDFQLPTFIHLPMILGSDGSRLSKRHGSMNIMEYKDQGFLPDALLNYLVRLGWSHGDEEIFSKGELINKFNIESLNKSSAKFDLQKLKWVNQQHLLTSDNNELAAYLVENCENQSINLPTEEVINAFSEAYKSRVENLNELISFFESLYSREFKINEEAAKKHLKIKISKPLNDLLVIFQDIDWNSEAIHQAIKDVCERNEIGFGKIGQPLRVAITGNTISPSIDVTATLLDKKIVNSRIKKAIEYIGNN